MQLLSRFHGIPKLHCWIIMTLPLLTEMHLLCCRIPSSKDFANTICNLLTSAPVIQDEICDLLITTGLVVTITIISVVCPKVDTQNFPWDHISFSHIPLHFRALTTASVCVCFTITSWLTINLYATINFIFPAVGKSE